MYVLLIITKLITLALHNMLQEASEEEWDRRVGVMDSPGQHIALLLGLVEVTRPVTPLDEEAQARVFTMCHAASTGGSVEDPSWLGRLERGLMGVEVITDQKHLHVISNEVLVGEKCMASRSSWDRIVVCWCTEANCDVLCLFIHLTWYRRSADSFWSTGAPSWHSGELLGIWY